MPALKPKKSQKTLYLFAAVIVTAIAVIMAERQGVVDSDYFWHLTLGKSIWQNKAIPTQDTFSWLSPELNLQETAHSWLSSLILYAFSCISVNPVYGMLAFIAVTVFAYCLFIEYIWGRQIKDPFMNVLALALVTLPLDWAGRPQSIGLTLFAIGFYLLNKVYEEPDTKLRWLLPVVSVLWANLHGGALPILFAFNLLFLVLCFAPDINAFDIYNEKGDSKKRFRALFQVFLSDILAGLLNPYGIKLYIYFFVTNNETTKKYVSEWMPSHLANEVVFLCLAFLFLIVAYRMKVKLTEFAPYLCCLFMTAMYVRIRSYWVIVMTPLIYRFLTSLISAQENRMWKAGGRPNSSWAGNTKKYTIAAAAVLVLVSAVYAPSMANDPDKTGDYITADLVSYIQDLNPQRLYTSYNDGGYCIYHGIKSFADSRADLFPDDVIEASVNFAFMSYSTDTGMEDCLNQFDFDAILLRRSQSGPCIEFMNQLSGWTQGYKDDYFVVFVPSET